MNYDTNSLIDYFTNINDSNMNNNLDLFGPYEGFIKGNLFKNLYDSYKNLKPANLNINNEQDELLLNVLELSFAEHELNLLLDNYPNNQNALKLFNQYSKMEADARKNYERRFGPLEVTSDMNNNAPFAWEATKWPWEM